MLVQKHTLNGRLEHVDILGLTPAEFLTIKDALRRFAVYEEVDETEAERAYRILERMDSDE